ncbi:MAG TPA: hypothetical protein PKL77_02975 [Candidatus Omnitrophota bacterium]|nr:hypothetical protein [Candidatus Omnitrophota bacterium]HPT07230.1 hypothetical protein [Candidatus Omnitrophota bacterium]
MNDTVMVQYAGQEVPAVPVDISQSREQWSEYVLDDGTLLRIKLIVTNILRLEGKFDEENNPVYLVKSTNVTSVKVPGNLKKR